MKSNKIEIVIIWFLACLSVFFLGGCFFPSITHCTGEVTIQHVTNSLEKHKATGRYIVISYWDYPTVNSKPGKIVLDDIFVTEDMEFTTDFGLRGYWIFWGVALGVQHIAPEPGLMVIHKDYPASWDTGGHWENDQFVYCCQKPVTKRKFHIRFIDKVACLVNEEREFERTKRFINEFITIKGEVIEKLEKSKTITDKEKQIVLEKLNQIDRMIKAAE